MTRVVVWRRAESVLKRGEGKSEQCLDSNCSTRAQGVQANNAAADMSLYAGISLQKSKLPADNAASSPSVPATVTAKDASADTIDAADKKSESPAPVTENKSFTGTHRLHAYMHLSIQSDLFCITQAIGRLLFDSLLPSARSLQRTHFLNQ